MLEISYSFNILKLYFNLFYTLKVIDAESPIVIYGTCTLHDHQCALQCMIMAYNILC